MNDHETFLLLAAKQISERLSDEEEADLSAHLASCPTCRATMNAMRRDDILLRGELGAVPVSPAVRRRVLDEAAGVRRFDPRLILALAATLLVASIGIPLLAGGAPVRTLHPTAPAPSVAGVSPSASESASPSIVESPSPSGPGQPLPTDGPYVTGNYVYGDAIKRRDSIAAYFDGRPTGEWSRTIPATGDGNVYGGPISCLVIEGNEAWIAGPATTATDGTRDRAVFMHVIDGGAAGAGDGAFLVLNTEGQTLTTMEEWCRRRLVSAPPYRLVSGDIIVSDGSR
jgi:hypothetical protein